MKLSTLSGDLKKFAGIAVCWVLSGIATFEGVFVHAREPGAAVDSKSVAYCSLRGATRRHRNRDAMAHPIEAIIREAYAAFARGDLDGYFGACSEDWNFNIAGQGAIAGTYRGKQGLYELAQKAMATTNSTFQEDVEDVLANDQHGIVLARHRFTRGGQQQEYHTVHVYEIRNGKLVTCWEHPRDQAAFDAAWGPRVESART